MANIKFKNVILHHFMSYDHEDFSLDRNGYIFISGENNNDVDNAKSNGSGKSSLFSALCWCLTGETPSGNKQVENIYLSGETYVQVNFDIDKDSYSIKRTKNPSNLFITINGEDKSGKGIRDTEKLLEDYLPDVTSSLINSVIILGQGLPKRFTNNTPSGRKEILEKLSNSDFMIADIKNRLGERQDKVAADKEHYQSILIETQTKIDMLSKMVQADKETLANINVGELEINLDRLKSDSIKLNNDIDTFTAARDESNSILSTKLAEVQRINEMFTDEYKNLGLISQEDLDNLVAKIASLNAELRSKEAEVKKLESVTDVCPTCGQKLPDVVKFDTTDLRQKCEELRINIGIMEGELKSSKKINAELVAQLDEKYAKMKTDLNSSITTLQDDIRNYDNIIGTKSTEHRRVTDEIIKTETELNTAESLKESLKENIKSKEHDLEVFKREAETANSNLEETQQRIEILSRMSTLIRRDFRGYLLSNIIEFISTKCKKYSTEVFGSDNFLFTLDGNNISISYDGKEYESLSGGEKQKADVIIQLAIRDMMCCYLNFSSNILVLDEITDSLDVTGSQNILDLISTELTDVEAIYIISHHSDFSIPWDEEIKVIKDNDRISRVA